VTGCPTLRLPIHCIVLTFVEYTGKTFIGGLIARILRGNTDASILCLCYTNHALDQFLEHMMDAGEKLLVRLGSRSRSGRVSRYNLRELARQKAQMAPESNRRFKQVTAQMHGAKEKIEEGIELIKLPAKWDTPDGGVQKYLKEELPEYHSCLCIPHLDDGFQIVGPDSKPLASDSLWKAWYRGDKFPMFLESFMPEDLPDFNAFWSISPIDRLAMANEWKKEMIAAEIQDFKQLVTEFQVLCDERRSIKQQQDHQILQEARVIGATTTGAAQHKQLLTAKKPEILIVEEAGEVLEAHVLAALQADSTKHLILIGDHMQLRPKVETYHLTAVSNMGYTFDQSLFERLILSDRPSVTLGVQHRMRPSISSIIRTQTYPDLVDHTSVKRFPDIQGIKHNLVFIDHIHNEDFPDDGDEDVRGTSKSNGYEVDLCLAIAKYLLQQGYRPERLAILTPYLGQLQQIVHRVKNEMDVTAFLNERDCRDLEELEETERIEERGEFGVQSLRCSSIDNFQGEEADIVLISLVRSNKHGRIGFLKENQRVNVLMSRAKIGMIIIGNSQTLRASKQGGKVWDPILCYLESNSFVHSGLPTYCALHPDDESLVLSNPEDFRLLRPNGGCSRICGQRMDCGHQCRLSCHPFDREHNGWTATKCVEPCKRVPTDCTEGHSCTKLCREDCGPCTRKMGPFQLLWCSHVAEDVHCYEVCDQKAIEALSKKCSKEVEFFFESCGHTVKTTCANSKKHDPCCPHICGKVVESCGHSCANVCGHCQENHQCNRKCERTLFCGHMCERSCHSGDCLPCDKPCVVRCVHSKCPKLCQLLCSSCVEPCDWTCEHKGTCELACGAPCTRLPCNEVSDCEPQFFDRRYSDLNALFQRRDAARSLIVVIDVHLFAVSPVQAILTVIHAVVTTNEVLSSITF
jgi:hypothetical protein